MEVETLLKERETITRGDGMDEVLGAAVGREVVVEIRLDRDDTPFHGHFIDMRGSSSWQEGTFLLSPLEPALGNIRIRGSSIVRLRFALGVHLLEGKVGFLAQERVEGSPCLRLMMPAVLGVLSRRKLYRHPIVPEVACRVLVSSRRVAEKEGDLLDLHEEGMGFWTVPHGERFQPEEYVRITFQPLLEGVAAFTVSGNIRYVVTERRPEIPTLSRERCGVSFHQVGEYLLFKKFLDRVRQASPDPSAVKKRQR